MVSLRVRRLEYRATHRGTRELDLILRAMWACINTSDELHVRIFEQLIQHSDPVLQRWLLTSSAGVQIDSAEFSPESVQLIKNWHQMAIGGKARILTNL